MMIKGSIVLFAGSTAPEGWLICDGSEVSRITYSSLFEVVGTLYGEGDGETTFNLPDLSGRVLIGASDSHTMASHGGEESHVLSISEMPEHTHSVPPHGHNSSITASTPVLSHTITQAAFTYSAPNGTMGANNHGGPTLYNGTTATAATLSTSVGVANHPETDCDVTCTIEDCPATDTSSVGEGLAHNNMQPFITMNYIIFAG